MTPSPTMSSIQGAIRATGAPARHASAHKQQARPFITIAREPFTGGTSLAQALAQRLNQLEHADPPWEAYDRELVQKIAADHHVSATLLDTLEEQNHSWVRSLCQGMTFQGPTDDGLFRRMAESMLALARAGRVILVGRGGVHITSRLPGGLHIHLTAPAHYRAQRLMETQGLSQAAAQRRLRELDANRESFHRTYFPDRPLTSDVFNLTLNTSVLSEKELVDAIVPLVPVAARMSVKP